MPRIFVIGGPNGAGKTTTATRLLPDAGCREFVNADAIAAGLSPFQPASVALQAGRLMLQRLESLAALGVDFGFESTLAARTFVSFLESCRERGYEIHVLYVWLQDVELAVARVAARVEAGGHAIPEETIRRRYETGRRNAVNLYLPLADEWQILDNSTELVLVAEGGAGKETMIHLPHLWEMIHAK